MKFCWKTAFRSETTEDGFHWQALTEYRWHHRSIQIDLQKAMYYSVLDAQGNRYGPVDLPTLNQWVRDGRIVPATQILVESTQRVVPATMIPGLNLNLAPGHGGPLMPQPPYAGPQRPAMPPGPAPYAGGPLFNPRIDAGGGEEEYKKSLIYSSVGGALAFTCVAPLGLILALAGLHFAHESHLDGHQSSRVAYAVAIIALIVALIRTSMYVRW
jgi:hypothetical protein